MSINGTSSLCVCLSNACDLYWWAMIWYTRSNSTNFPFAYVLLVFVIYCMSLRCCIVWCTCVHVRIRACVRPFACLWQLKVWLEALIGKEIPDTDVKGIWNMQAALKDGTGTLTSTLAHTAHTTRTNTYHIRTSHITDLKNALLTNLAPTGRIICYAMRKVKENSIPHIHEPPPNSNRLMALKAKENINYFIHAVEVMSTCLRKQQTRQATDTWTKNHYYLTGCEVLMLTWISDGVMHDHCHKEILTLARPTYTNILYHSWCRKLECRVIVCFKSLIFTKA